MININEENPLQPIILRRRYSCFKNPSYKIESVFLALADENNNKSIAQIARETNICVTTLYSWDKNLKKDPTWRPLKKHYSESHKVFPLESELNIADYINTNYIEQGRSFLNEDLKKLALDTWHSLPGEYTNNKKFSASIHWICDFKKRFKFSSKKPSSCKEGAISKEEIQTFKERVGIIFEKFDEKNILNADETFWRFVRTPARVFSKRGNETVRIKNKTDPKKGISLLATIDAEGNKYPLLFIAQGKTHTCEKKQVGNYVCDSWVSHSISGWMNEEVWMEYLTKLRKHKNCSFALFVDQYGSHTTDKVIELAATLEIEMVFIPKGCTDQYQPLDILIFGIFKSRGNRLYHIREDNHDPAIQKKQSFEDIISSWDSITKEVIVCIVCK